MSENLDINMGSFVVVHKEKLDTSSPDIENHLSTDNVKVFNSFEFAPSIVNEIQNNGINLIDNSNSSSTISMENVAIELNSDEILDKCLEINSIKSEDLLKDSLKNEENFTNFEPNSNGFHLSDNINQFKNSENVKINLDNVQAPKFCDHDILADIDSNFITNDHLSGGENNSNFILDEWNNDAASDKNNPRRNDVINDELLDNQVENVSTLDENDFRRNIVQIKEKDDKCTTNQYVNNDNNDVHNENIIKNTINVKNKDENDFRVNIIERNVKNNIWTTNQYVHNDINDVHIDNKDVHIDNKDVHNDNNEAQSNDMPIQNIIKNTIDDVQNTDETDFSVNIIERNDKEDNWTTNLYLHNDNNDVHIDNKDVHIDNRDMHNDNNDLHFENILKNNINDVQNKDETDFRVNIIERNDKKENRTTNLYLHNDNNDVHIDNKDVHNDNKDVHIDNKDMHNDNNDLHFENILKNNINDVQNKDETDFRVNIIERNNKEDNWTTNLYVHNDNNEDNAGINLIEQLDNVNSKVDINNSDNVDTCKTQDNKEILSIENINKIDIENENKYNCDMQKINKETNMLSNINNNTNSSLVDNIEIIDHSNNKSMTTNIIITNQDELITKDNINNTDNCQLQSNNQININENDCPIDNVEIQNIKETKDKPLFLGNIIRRNSSFSYLNSIITILINCEEFPTSIINYHHNDWIAHLDFDKRTDISWNDAIFINDLCKLFYLLVECKSPYNEELCDKLNNSFERSSKSFNLYSGFNFLLDKIHLITKNVTEDIVTINKNEEISYDDFKSQNKGLIGNLFLGQISEKIFCKNCEFLKENLETITSLLLKIPKCETSLSLENCLAHNFSESKVETSDKCCDNPMICKTRQIVYGPEYLFICLERKSGNGETDYTYVDSDNGLIIKTTDGLLLYSLHSVIDELEKNNKTNYVVKCLSKDWWIMDGHEPRRIHEFEVISEYTFGFMLKRQD